MRWLPRPRPKTLAAPALAVLLISVGLTVAGAFLVWRYYQAKFESVVANELSVGRRNIISALQLQVQTLEGVRALFESSERVEEDEFTRFVARNSLTSEYQLIGFAKRAGAQGTGVPIQYVESAGGSVKQLVGVDLGGTAEALQELSFARDSGGPALSNRIHLLTDSQHGPPPGFVIYMPVYHRGGPAPATVASRREALIGYVFMQLSAEWFFSQAIAEVPASMLLQVYESTGGQSGQLLYASGNLELAFLAGPLKRAIPVQVFDQVWTVEVVVGSSYGLTRVAVPFTALLLGFLASGAIYLLTWTQTRGRQVAEKLLRELRVSQQALLEANRNTRERERQLEESEERFRALFEFNPDAAFTLDFEGRLVNLNPATERITGYRRTRLRGKHFDPLVLHEYVETTHAGFERASKGEAVELILKIRRRDRRIAELQVNAGPIEVGGVITGVFVAARDITEEQESKRKLAQSEAAAHFAAEASARLSVSLEYDETMRAVVESAVPFLADGAAICLRAGDDEEAALLFLHHRAEKMPLLEKLTPQLCKFCYAQDPQKKKLAPSHLPRIDEASLYKLGIPPGIASALPLRSLLMVPLDYRNESLGTLALLMTEAGREFGPQEMALAHDFGRRISAAVENAVLYRRVRKAVYARDEFLSIGSHELKTPVTSIQLQIQLLMASLQRGSGEAPDRERILRSLGVTDVQVNRLVRLINELLDVSRLTTGHLRLEKEAGVDLAEVVGDIIGRFRINHSGLPIVFEAPVPVPGVWDRMRLEQVATNLISNAIKYGDGKEVSVSVAGDGETARLTVRDQGIGISEADIERIFGRFERAVSVRNFAGLGMGLYIVKQIIEAHGGTIRVVSQPGEGSTFIVDLPIRG